MDDQLAEDIVKATMALSGLAVRIEDEPREEGDQVPLQVAHSVREAGSLLQHYLANYPRARPCRVAAISQRTSW